MANPNPRKQYRRPTPRQILFSKYYTSPRSYTFNNAGETWWKTVPPAVKKDVYNHIKPDKEYRERVSKKYISNPKVRKLISKQLKKYMAQFEYNIDNVFKVLKENLESENRTESFAAKKELLAHLKDLSKMYHQYNLGDTEEELNKLQDVELIKEIAELSKEYTQLEEGKEDLTSATSEYISSLDGTASQLLEENKNNLLTDGEIIEE